MPPPTTPPPTFESAALQRSLDRYYVWGLVFMLVLIVSFPIYRLREPALRRDALREQQVTYTALGDRLFAQSCAECHGIEAIGGTAPTLNAEEFLESTSDAQIQLLVQGGISGTSMSEWSLDFGGPLTDEQIRQIVTYLRSLEPDAPSVPDWRNGRDDGSD